MIPDGYRVVVMYDADKQKFVAKVPELGGEVSVAAETRAQAMAAVEEEMEKAIRRAAEDKIELPRAIDTSDFTGEITVRVTPTLHRDLAFAAVQDKLELVQYVAELLATSVTRRAYQPPRFSERSEGQRGNEQRGERTGGGKRGGRNNQYHNIMDDRASFIEYVRSLENKGGGGSGSAAGWAKKRPQQRKPPRGGNGPASQE